MLTFNDLGKMFVENILGKGENADHQHFLHFPQCFQPSLREIAPLKPH